MTPKGTSSDLRTIACRMLGTSEIWNFLFPQLRVVRNSVLVSVSVAWGLTDIQTDTGNWVLNQNAIFSMKISQATQFMLRLGRRFVGSVSWPSGRGRHDGGELWEWPPPCALSFSDKTLVVCAVWPSSSQLFSSTGIISIYTFILDSLNESINRLILQYPKERSFFL